MPRSLNKSSTRRVVVAAAPPPPWRPSAADLRAAANKTVADVIAPDLRLLFCGINPGLYTAAIGHHFGRPGNRFWPALHAGGFTPRVFSPFEEDRLLELGYGMTNLVERATNLASELTREELHAGGRRLIRKLARYRPRCVAVLGVTSFRVAFARPTADVGPQAEPLGDTPVWLLPNPSGLNAHYTPAKLARLFAALRKALDR